MTKEFYISDKALAAMNAVEGLVLCEESKKRLKELDEQGLTTEEKIEAIKASYKSD